jgi:hypothetical protein
MGTVTTLATAGARAGTVGSMITAFSVNRALSALDMGQRMLRLTGEALATNQPEIPILRARRRNYDTAHNLYH